ncbi:hypothetical protein BP422_15545 [Brevibacillus formosus]|uniref:Uncharacterized protein n=1 Tax=Brevibacillus formosus TaxID=54913 RepID=A0A220MJ17_9BACL|nr:hypothetical protein [Brevibacillus formosus]ASJ54855.1 hypothetical protein BP422_15545 [Brevibacillus formosus]
MVDDKLAELIRLRLTQEDVFELFKAAVNPIIEETGTAVIASIRAAALRGENMYTDLYGNLFPAPISNGEIHRLVLRKIVDQYNSLPERAFDVTLVERQGGANGYKRRDSS